MTGDPLFQDPAGYDRISTVQAAWGATVVADVVRLLDGKPVDVAADIGCGSGRVTLLLVEAVRPARVILSDISRGMLDSAVQRVGTLAATESVLGDATAFTPSRPCNLIFSNAVFHWIADHDAFARSVAAALAPGGLLRMQGGGAGNLMRAGALARRVFEDVTGRAPPAYPANFSTPEDWTRRLTALGLVGVDCRLKDAATRFNTAEAFREFTAGVTLLPLLRELESDGVRARFTEAYTRAAEHALGLTLDYIRLEVTAWRAS